MKPFFSLISWSENNALPSIEFRSSCGYRNSALLWTSNDSHETESALLYNEKVPVNRLATSPFREASRLFVAHKMAREVSQSTSTKFFSKLGKTDATKSVDARTNFTQDGNSISDSWFWCNLPSLFSNKYSGNYKACSSALGSDYISFNLTFFANLSKCRWWKRGEDFSVMKTIAPLDPLGTTGRICLKSPLNGMHFPPNGTSGDFIIARRFRSTASTQYLTHITISSQII